MNTRGQVGIGLSLLALPISGVPALAQMVPRDDRPCSQTVSLPNAWSTSLAHGCGVAAGGRRNQRDGGADGTGLDRPVAVLSRRRVRRGSHRSR